MNMMIDFEDEPDLQRKISGVLNERGFNFKKTESNAFCDLIDDVNNIDVEVKPETFAPAQLIYGLAKEIVKGNVSNVKYIGLACCYDIRFYKCPSFDILIEYARSIDSVLETQPSSVNNKENTDKAFDLLGFHHSLWDYHSDDFNNENFDHSEIFLNDSNYEYFKLLFLRYNINPVQFLFFIEYVESNGGKIKISSDGRIYEDKNLNIFKNQQNGYHDKTIKKTLDGDIIHNEQDIRPVKNKHDRDFFESIRIKGVDIEKIIHKMDELTPLKIRRQIGKFFSNMKLGEYLAGIIIDFVNPDFIVEPMVGGGSLIAPFVEKGIPCVINDINKGHIDLLRGKYDDQIKGYHWDDFILKPMDKIFNEWNIPKDGTFLIYTNSPFGTVSTNKLASKSKEFTSDSQKDMISRKIKIDYGNLDKLYGKGDLVIPSIGKMIEVIKQRGTGYLAFFSPVDIYLGRNRYNKLLKALLKNFKFIYAEVFSGSLFSSGDKNADYKVSGIKPISVAIWEYRPNVNTPHNSISFLFGKEEYGLKVLPLLKDGWKYDTRERFHNEIAAQHNETFNCPTGKMISSMVEKGGSEMVPENVIISLNVDQVPSELIYGLWSRTVGRGGGAIINPSIIFNGCYVHLPDFTRIEALEIIAYSVLYTLITEKKQDYCKGKIGFTGLNHIFNFGGKRLTDGASYLINTFGDQPAGENETIKSVFDQLKEGKNPDVIDKKLRIYIRGEIEKRLNEIGYWDYLPIPDIETKDKNKKQPTLI